jgi:hypothetical protein
MAVLMFSTACAKLAPAPSHEFERVAVVDMRALIKKACATPDVEAKWDDLDKDAICDQLKAKSPNPSVKATAPVLDCNASFHQTLARVYDEAGAKYNDGRLSDTEIPYVAFGGDAQPLIIRTTEVRKDLDAAGVRELNLCPDKKDFSSLQGHWPVDMLQGPVPLGSNNFFTAISIPESAGVVTVQARFKCPELDDMVYDPGNGAKSPKFRFGPLPFTFEEKHKGLRCALVISGNGTELARQSFTVTD